MEKELAELGKLSVEFELDYLYIKEIHIIDQADRHSVMELRLVLKEAIAPEDVLPLEDAPIKVMDPGGDNIFVGIAQSIGLHNEDQYSELAIDAKSLSIKSDRKKMTRTFQDTGKMLSQVANTVMGTYGIQVEVNNDFVVEQMLYQNSETDWAFLKRIANQFGAQIFTDAKSDLMRIAVGTFPFSNKTLGPETRRKKADVGKDIEKFIEIKENIDAEAEAYEYETAIVASYDLTIGAGYMADSEGERTRRVVKSEIVTRGEAVENRLTLAFEEGCRPSREACAASLNLGDYIKGKILRVQGTYVKIHFNCDESQDEGAAMWIPFESPMNNYMYAMPDEGDTVFVYYENNGKAVALGSQRSDGGAGPDYADPAVKTMTSTNKMIKLTPGSCELVGSRAAYDAAGGNQSMIRMTDEKGVYIYSTQDIRVEADKRLKITAVKETIETGDITKEFDKFGAAHKAGEALYLAGAGSPAYNPGGEILKQLGSNIAKSFSDGIMAMAVVIPDFVQNISGGGGGGGEAPAPEDAAKPPQLAPEEAMKLMGIENCSFGVGASELKITGGAITIKTPVYKQLGYNKGSHPEIKAPSVMDTILDGVQLALDVAGCFPLLNVPANGANALISVARGDFFGAACSLAGCFIPTANVAGKGMKAAVTAAKAASKTKKAAEIAKTVTRIISGAMDYNAKLQALDGIIDLGRQIQSGTIKLSDPRTWYQAVESVMNLAPGRRKKGGKGNKGGDSADGGGKKPPTDKSGANGKNNNSGGDSANGNPKAATKSCGDPINVVTGSFTIAMTDLVLKDLGEDFILTRHYESLYENKGQHLGSRWLLNLGGRLERKERQIRILMEGLKIETFEQKDGIWENLRGADRSLILTEEKNGYDLKCVKERKTLSYNEFGRLVHITDQNGNRVHIDYIGSYISKITLANGKQLKFYYDKNKLSRVTDMIGRQIQYRYEGELLTQVTYPNGGTVTYQYTQDGYISAITDQNGNRYVENQYDNEGRVVRQKLANGSETILFYQDQDRMTTVSTPTSGARVIYEYNRAKLVVKTTYADGSQEQTRYDDKENITWEKDRNGNETYYTYNQASQLTEKKHPNGLIQTITYDQFGRKTQEKDNAGTCVRYTYDNRGNLTKIQSRIEGERWKTETYAYDAAGRVTTHTDANGNQTQYTYKPNNSQPDTITTAEKDTFDYEYDEAGRLMRIKSPLGEKEYAYNHLDLKTLEIDALGNTTKYEYDKLANLIKTILPNQYDEKRMTGKSWQTIYDALDKPIAKIDPLGNTIATPRDPEENITKEINPNTYDHKTGDGQGIENTWDEEKRKIKIRYPGGGVERIKYDAKGNITKKIQPEQYNETIDDGPGYTYQYDQMDRLIKITNPKGITEKTYTYDLLGNITKETDAAGYAPGQTDQDRPGTLYTYNHIGWLTEKRQPARLDETGQTKYQVTQYTYDACGNITEEKRCAEEQDKTGASGRMLSIRFSYDKQNRLTKIEDNTGAQIQYKYNCLNQKTSEKRKINDQTWMQTHYTYDAAGRLTETAQRADKQGSGKFTAETKYQHDKTGNIVKITTPAGYKITRQYDDADRLIEETHTDKHNNIENKTQYIYDKAGNLTKTIDTNGAEETYEYDHMNRLTQKTGKNGAKETIKYDKNGRMTKKTYPTAPKGYEFSYDELGRTTKITAPDGTLLTQNTYDKAGNLKQKLDATGSGVTYEYEISRRIKTIATQGGARQTYEYDAQGNITAVTSGNNNRTQYKLDKWGRITQIIKADGTKEYYSYDYAGNITETIDAEGNKTTYEYNHINKVKEITDQAGNKDTFYYDEESRLKKSKTRNGKQIEYTYNIYGSLTEKTETTSGQRQTYQYHKDGKLKAAIADGMRYGYEYYEDGKLKEKTASGKTLIKYEYDLSGNITKQTDITGKQTQYSYTERDLLKEITDEGKQIVKFSYNADGTTKEIQNANGMKTTYAYDIDKNIQELNIQLNGETIAKNRYAYDESGNRTEKQQLRGTTTYTYDSLNRLTKAQYPDYGEELYYDKTGNRTKRIANGIEEYYNYDQRNRLTSHIKQGKETQYHYDNAGNLLDDGERKYQYDGFNRNTRVETKDGQVQINRYDAEGLRYEIEENNKLVQFIYNENKEVIIEKTEENLKRLIRGSDLWASECTYEKTWYHYASDEQGSIIFVADEKEVKNRYEYDAFGNAVICEEKVENRYRYTGQQYDQITQQYYLRARYYNPVIARFTQEDAYRGDGLNLYAYCDNNPVEYYDPSGYCGDSKDPLNPNNKSANNSDRNNNSPTNRSANTDGTNNSSENRPPNPQAETPHAGRGNVSNQATTINPNEIRFSQSSVNGAEEIVQSMRTNGWNGDPIDVVRMEDGGLTTIDNTRVVAAREAGIDVSANIHNASDPLPDELIERFTTKKGVPTTWGEAIQLRIGKQNASFRNNNPLGANNMGRVGR